MNKYNACFSKYCWSAQSKCSKRTWKMHFHWDVFVSMKNYPFPDEFLSYQYILDLYKHVCLVALCSVH